MALVLADDHVIELDGRKPGPIRHGPSSEGTFLADAAVVCDAYMKLAPDAVNFSLAALVKQ